MLAGVEWEATAKTSGEILIGGLIQEFNDPAEGSSNHYNWDARVHWAPRPYSKLTAFTNRTAREDAAGGIGHFLADSFGVTWRHGFSERLVMNTGLDYTLARYSTGRRDNYLGFQVGVTHKLTHWLDAGAQYRFLNRDSNIPGIAYSDNMVWANLRVSFTYGL